MAGTFTLDEVRDLLNSVVSGIRVGDNGDDTLFTLKEVAARIKCSLRELERDCRAGRIEHTKRGRTIGLTSRQITLLLENHRVTDGQVGSASRLGDDLAEARSASSKAASRRSPRRNG